MATRYVLACTLALAAAFGGPAAMASDSVAVSVEGWVPGFEKGELQPFVAKQMNEAGIAGWHFASAGTGTAPAPDRVEWRFKPNPYAGGLTYRHPGILREIDKIFGSHRLISVEVRLYRNGEYQLLESAQPTVQGGPRDADLQKQIVALTKSLESAANPGARPAS